MDQRLSKTKKISQTTSLCPLCKEGIPAEIIEKDNQIFMVKTCKDHGQTEALISSSASWYHENMKYTAILKAPEKFTKTIEQGCPFDCGTCTQHQQKTYLPVIPITSACNLDCPVCYTINKNNQPYHMSLEEFGRLLEVLKENDPTRQIINFTGGEPTLHPQLVEMIEMCHQVGIHRITLSTHGLSFIKDEKMLKKLAELGIRVVLSFHSFEDSTNKKIAGANLFQSKMKVLDLLEKYKVDTTLIPVIALGCNDHELKKMIDLVLEKDCIRSLEIHTMTFTGDGGSSFDSSTRITIHDVLQKIESATNGSIKRSDFLPSPCAHPLCYQTSYLLKIDKNEYLPFARFMNQNNIRKLLADNLYIEPGKKTETVLEETIMELWAEEENEQNKKVLKTLKNLIKTLFPTPAIPYKEQQILSERSAKTIYIHSHMDEGNFDSNRIAQCCVGVPVENGGNVPTCSYNVLYRSRDSRFSVGAPLQKPLGEFGGGRKSFLKK